MSNNKRDIIQYVPFSSFVHPSFWYALTETKLEIDKLSDKSRQIFGRFTYRQDVGSVFEVDGSSFNSNLEPQLLYESVVGTIMNKNTIEEFKDINKSALLNSIGEIIWSEIKNKSWIENPKKLHSFFILSYADLKKYSYFYWFAFPSPSQPTVYLSQKGACITDIFDESQIKQIRDGYNNLENSQKSYFAVDLQLGAKVLTLSQVLNCNKPNLTGVIFGFTDSSNNMNPGWPLRMFLAALLDHNSNLAGQNIKVLSLRMQINGDITGSYFYNILIPQDVKPVESSGWVGWERNDKGNFGPRLANMSASMDPIKLADSSSDLNLKLMKWRLIPDVNLDIMKTTKCLLLGSGTLGCHVARNLLAWGYRNITFLDNGKVSYSNPTRQVLFTHKDCLNGGKMKATAAADNLKDILPSANTQSIIAHIPMPGHPIGESLKNETLSNIEILEKAILDNDVIFLLLDTREARWLPTLLASCHRKIVINAALGFDSYLVMRHGISTNEKTADMSTSYISGSQLGCYFCNDVTAPGNSLKDRTLDQQCTVTRPGVAAIAAALAVEVLTALLQHPLRVDAPAAHNLTEDLDKGLESQAQGILGPIPHTIRGFLWSHQMIVPTCMKFKQCIACSEPILSKYKEDGIQFLIKVFNSANYLEEVTGLLELHLSAELTEIMTLDDDDFVE